MFLNHRAQERKQKYNAIQYTTIQHNTTQHNTIQYNTTQYNTIQILLALTKGAFHKCRNINMHKYQYFFPNEI